MDRALRTVNESECPTQLRLPVIEASRHIIIMEIIFRPNSGNLYGRLLKEIWAYYLVDLQLYSSSTSAVDP